MRSFSGWQRILWNRMCCTVSAWLLFKHGFKLTTAVKEVVFPFLSNFRLEIPLQCNCCKLRCTKSCARHKLAPVELHTFGTHVISRLLSRLTARQTFAGDRGSDLEQLSNNATSSLRAWQPDRQPLPQSVLQGWMQTMRSCLTPVGVPHSL